ncbi:MAG: acyl-CoA thioesterase II [Proteobacteria bacterium]|nr:MAG: acyl-CoA thioesterase II [Pseudomonadota bacterium]
MAEALDKLLSLLDIKEIEKQVYLGHSEDLGFRNLFGGQVLGQALIAAGRTVEADRPPHSLHGYFIRPGNSEDPLYYEVDLIRSGRSFSTRRVVAKQNGLAIFSMSASFQAPESGLEHQIEMPSVPGPEGIASEQDRARQAAALIPEKSRAQWTRERPIEYREINPMNPFQPKVAEAKRQVWIKTAGALSDDPLLHRALLAYTSDFGLAGTALLPHGLSLMKNDVMMASLDHAMWFHSDFRFDDWLLYTTESSVSHGARGFNQGKIFTRDGRLVVSVTQEGLMRRSLKKPKD